MNKANFIINVAVSAFPLKTLDYLASENIDIALLKPGIKVLVPLKNKYSTGILIEVKRNSKIAINKLKKVQEIIDIEPVININLLNLCIWAKQYYNYSLIEILKSAIPKYLRQDNNKNNFLLVNEKNSKVFSSFEKKLVLNNEQQLALNAILNSINKFNCFLLNGVTGSGKTEIYLQIIEEVLKNQKQALVLVPEISLTPQIIKRFKVRFNFDIGEIHSNLTDKEKYHTWIKIKNNYFPVVIGTRSAIFSPLENLGLIVIDEEHDLSFKQQNGFKYSARDLAIVYAKQLNIPVILGSATPSLETILNAHQNKFIELNLPYRANNAKPPNFKIIDLRQEKLINGVSNKLSTKIKEHLANKNQILIFINRRGFAPVLMCHNCGNSVKCKRCDLSFTYHVNPEILRCHYCNSEQNINLKCSICNKNSLQPLGVAIEKIMHGLKKIFPSNEIIQIDSDNKKNLSEKFDKIINNEVQILVGTQMLAKGHHFPNVTLVGIINADSGFYNTDFRATEKFGQLLLQVAGRAGREDKTGEVYIQTYNPENPYLLDLINYGYKHFANNILSERKNINLPPFSHLTVLKAEAIQKEKCKLFLQDIKNKIIPNIDIQIFGPIESPIARRQGRYRYQLLLQTNYRKIMQNTVKYIYNTITNNEFTKYVRWSIDVDPKDLS